MNKLVISLVVVLLAAGGYLMMSPGGSNLNLMGYLPEPIAGFFKDDSNQEIESSEIESESQQEISLQGQQETTITEVEQPADQGVAEIETTTEANVNTEGSDVVINEEISKTNDIEPNTQSSEAIATEVANINDSNAVEAQQDSSDNKPKEVVKLENELVDMNTSCRK